MTNRQIVEKLMAIDKRKGDPKENWEDLKEEAKPLLAILNQEGKRIAKEFGKKHYPITFDQLGRLR